MCVSVCMPHSPGGRCGLGGVLNLGKEAEEIGHDFRRMLVKELSCTVCQVL